MPKLARSELWSHGPETQEDYKSQMLAGSDYELDRDLLGDPAVVIRPDVGDLVLFPSSLYHRTIPFDSEKERLSLAFDVVPLR